MQGLPLPRDGRHPATILFEGAASGTAALALRFQAGHGLLPARGGDRYLRSASVSAPTANPLRLVVTGGAGARHQTA